jgi:hypothetical protein
MRVVWRRLRYGPLGGSLGHADWTNQRLKLNSLDPAETLIFRLDLFEGARSGQVN